MYMCLGVSVCVWYFCMPLVQFHSMEFHCSFIVALYRCNGSAWNMCCPMSAMSAQMPHFKIKRHREREKMKRARAAIIITPQNMWQNCLLRYMSGFKRTGLNLLTLKINENWMKMSFIEILVYLHISHMFLFFHCSYRLKLNAPHFKSEKN